MNEPILVTVTRDFNSNNSHYIDLDCLLPDNTHLYLDYLGTEHGIILVKRNRLQTIITDYGYITSFKGIIPAGTKLEWRIESEQATRYNEDKLRWSLVDFKSLEPLVEVLEYGTKKYEVDNWKKGLELRDIMDSLMRHVVEINNNQYIDEESKCLHMGHIMANAMFWIYFYNKNKENGNSNKTD